jgi:UDP-N-acetylglucosamine 2-epimerase (non-hydrolysing)
MKKIMLAFGTRPEAIKMCPLVRELKSRSGIGVVVCVTGQHREMLYGAMSAFDVRADYDLSIMRPSQSLFDVTEDVISGMERVLLREMPDILLVHGDTTTAFASALAAFYLKIPVGHVEAGLRTWDLYSPYPEEFNRQGIGILAKYHFAPTRRARDNLLREGRKAADVFLVGNTVIDALRFTVREDFSHPLLEWIGDAPLVLLTAHRRESVGEPQRRIFRAVRRVVEEHGDVRVVYPVHKNPAVREVAEEVLGGCSRIRLIEPPDTVDFHNFLARSYLVLTDSGGIQEEAPAFGKPTLVLRDTTERPEGIEAGVARLVGTDEEAVYREFTRLLDDNAAYAEMSRAANPYGDGFAAKRIADILERM